MQEVRKKIVLFGNVGVGKTSITKKYVTNEFSDIYKSSIGLSIEKKSLAYNGLTVILMIWDLAGEIFKSKQFDAYLKGAHGILGVFDISRPHTYDLLSDAIYQKTDCPKVIVANKIDLVTDPDAIAAEMSIDHYCSAKTGDGLDQAFEDLVFKMMS